MLAPSAAAPIAALPLPLDAYPIAEGASLLQVLSSRVAQFPFNAVATTIFLLAVIHTFFAKRFLVLADHAQQRSDARCRAEGREPCPSVLSEFLHFLGDVEVIFGLWV